VYLHTASAVGEARSASWPLVAGSGTGELAGIGGTITIDVLPEGGHVLTLDYELG
jgi:hypothetical protein